MHQSIIKAAIQEYLTAHHLQTVHLARLAVEREVCCRATVFKWLAGNRSITVDKAEQLAGILGLTVTATTTRTIT